MKTFLKILAGLAVLIAIGLSVVFYATSGMTDTADEFFKAVKQQDMTKARGYLAEEFKASTDEAALKAFLSKSALLNFKEASWSERSVNNGRGELNGSITTETGGNVPIRVVFVKEQDMWKIYALQKPTAGIQSSETTSTQSILICRVAVLIYQVCILMGLAVGKEIQSAPNGRRAYLFGKFNPHRKSGRP